AEDGIRDRNVTGVQTCALPISTRVVLHIDNIRLRHLFPQRLLSKRQLFNHWSKEKKRFRLSSYRVHGKELKFRKWLYQQRLHVRSEEHTSELQSRFDLVCRLLL